MGRRSDDSDIGCFLIAVAIGIITLLFKGCTILIEKNPDVLGFIILIILFVVFMIYVSKKDKG